MNNLRIIQTGMNNRYITYLKNNTPTHYGTMLSLNVMKTDLLSNVEGTQEMLISYKEQSQLWLTKLFTSQENIPKLQSDTIRKLTLNEYFVLGQIIKCANATYNKKMDKLILEAKK